MSAASMSTLRSNGAADASKRGGTMTTMGTQLHAQSLESLAFHESPSRRAYIRPDFFDSEGRWNRSILLEGEESVLAVHPSGRVSVLTAGGRTHRTGVPSAVSALLRPIHMPEAALELLPGSLAAEFERMSPLIHIASPTLFEALIKAVLRQVIRAAHATQLIDRFISSFGHALPTTAESRHYLFPTPDQVAQVADTRLRELGVGFKAKTIAAVVRTFAELPDSYGISESPEVLMEKLQTIPGVGRWSAGVALTEFLGAWSVYPIDDLAVRTWAKVLWPRVKWPSDSDAFAREWIRKTNGHTDVITFYLLTLGLYKSGNGLIALN